jgi:hypothetical protein
MGPSYTGSPLHRHERAVNVLVHGLKRWFLFPPGVINCDSDEQVCDWFDEYQKMSGKENAIKPEDRPFQGRQPIQFLQRPGDVVFIPSQWGHAVINLRESIGVAAELLKVRPCVFLRFLKCTNRSLTCPLKTIAFKGPKKKKGQTHHFKDLHQRLDCVFGALDGKDFSKDSSSSTLFNTAAAGNEGQDPFGDIFGDTSKPKSKPTEPSKDPFKDMFDCASAAITRDTKEANSNVTEVVARGVKRKNGHVDGERSEKWRLSDKVVLTERD